MKKTFLVLLIISLMCAPAPRRARTTAQSSESQPSGVVTYNYVLQ